MTSRSKAVLGAGVVVLVAFTLFITVLRPGDRAVVAVDDVLETAVALLSAAVCGWASVRGRPAHARAWAAMAVATLGWGLGQAYWSWQEIVAEHDVPFPSWADAGYLVFPVGAAAAVLLLQPRIAGGRSRTRAVFDGLMVATSLFLISWVSSLGATYHGGGESAFAFSIAMAYPIGDIAVVALALLLLSRLASRRLPLVLFALGVISMGLADSGFVYLTSSGSYQTGSIIDVGWVAAFVLVAVAAVADADTRPETAVTFGVSRLGVLLPYVPFLVGAGVLAVESWQSELDRVVVVAGAALIGLVLARQLLTLVENQRLVQVVQEREEELRHQAFHDSLTGLANRALFNDRMEHQVSLRGRAHGNVTVLFVDLDDFKHVNDQYGHAIGDALLVGVAERLRASVRVGDTVSRLGGDEFAVLLAEDDEPAQVAQRIQHSLDVPFQIGPHRVRVSASVGAASMQTIGEPERVTEQLLRSADVAMYAAKRGRKGSFVVFSSGMSLDGPVHRHIGGALPGSPLAAPPAPAPATG